MAQTSKYLNLVGIGFIGNIKDSLIHDIFKTRISIDDSIFIIIKQLQKKNIKMGILSNTALVTHSIVEELINISYFDYPFLSYLIDREKPDERIFEHVTDRIPYSKEGICLSMTNYPM